jgi:hypothetical protein
MMRKAFIHQVAIPIAIYYLSNANKKVNNTKTFKQLLNWNVIKLIDGKVFESDYFIDFNNYIKHAE